MPSACPTPEAYLDLPAAPEYLLQPLAGDEHGGQVILLPGGAKVHLDAGAGRARA